jgi:hypothetical protein
LSTGDEVDRLALAAAVSGAPQQEFPENGDLAAQV